MKVADLKPGIEAAIAEELAEVDAIANNPAPPTFDNTIAALERTGKAGERIGTIYDIWSGTLSTPEMRAIEREIEPELAAYNDKILQNEKLFRRIETVYDGRETASLTSEQKRLAWLRWNSFVRAGAKLTPAAKARVAAINKELPEALHDLQPEPARGRNRLRPLSRREGSHRPAARRARGRGPGRQGARQAGPVRDPQHALLDGPLPDLLGPAGPAREGLADLLRPRRQHAMQRTTARASRRS